MKSEPAKLFQFFANPGRQYCVPLYQRRYVWTKEKHWEPLWSEIEDRANRYLKQQDSVQGNESPSMHFLGAIVTKNRYTQGRGADKFDIVDGQQRLVTFQILFAAFRDCLRALKSESDEWLSSIQISYEDRTRNRGQINEDEKYKVWPTNKDRKIFKHILDANGIDNIDKIETPLVKAYNYFYDRIKEYCQSKNASDLTSINHVNALNDSLKNDFELVDIVLDPNDDPQIIFESLNDRGQPLLPSDLIRNFVLMCAQSKDGEGAVDNLYKQYWEDYDLNEDFWMQDDRHGRTTRKRIDLFVLHYLQSRQPNEKVSIEHLYKAFQEWWKFNNCNSNISNHLSVMKKHSDMFASIASPSGQGSLATFAKKLQILDTTTIYPVLLFLLVDQKGKIAENDLKGIFLDIESFLVRRSICGLKQNGYTNLFFGLLRELHSTSAINRKFVQDFLRKGKGVNTVWPSNKDFKDAWINRKNYESRNSKIIRMILTEINNEMYERKKDSEIINELTIEHILPEMWKNDGWPLLRSEWYENNRKGEEEQEETRERLLHTFGNLTLLTGELNSLASNASFEKKKSEIKNHTGIPLNRVFEIEDEWDEERIIKRGMELFGHAVKIWQRPE